MSLQGVAVAAAVRVGRAGRVGRRRKGSVAATRQTPRVVRAPAARLRRSLHADAAILRSRRSCARAQRSVGSTGSGLLLLSLLLLLLVATAMKQALAATTAAAAAIGTTFVIPGLAHRRPTTMVMVMVMIVMTVMVMMMMRAMIAQIVRSCVILHVAEHGDLPLRES